MSAIVIRDNEGTEVHRVSLDGKSERQIDRIELGLARNFDFERFTFATED